MSNLRLINETTTTAGVQSVNITEVFSSDFDIYVVMSSNLMANNSTATGANMRLIHSTGIVESGQIYDYGQEAHKGETSKGTNQSSTETRLWNTFGGIDDGGQGAGLFIDDFSRGSKSKGSSYLFIFDLFFIFLEGTFSSKLSDLALIFDSL